MNHDMGGIKLASRTGRTRRSQIATGLIGLTLVAVGSVDAVAQAPTQTPDTFKSEAGKLGAKKCANLFSGMGQAVTNGSTFAVRTETNKKAPDNHAVQGVVGMAYNLPELKGQAAGIMFAAPVGQGCEGQLVRVAPFQKSCQDVVGLLPAGSVPSQSLSGVPTYQLGGNQGQALLIASGKSCVVVTIALATQT